MASEFTIAGLNNAHKGQRIFEKLILNFAYGKNPQKSIVEILLKSEMVNVFLSISEIKHHFYTILYWRF